MKDPKLDPRTDATTQIDIGDLADVVLDDAADVVVSPSSGRGPKPPPLPPGGLVPAPPGRAQSQPPASTRAAPPAGSSAAPRKPLVYALILVVFFVVSGGGGAIWVRSSAPKSAPTAKASTTLPASPAASLSASAAPRVITIKAVDMNAPE